MRPSNIVVENEAPWLKLKIVQLLQTCPTIHVFFSIPSVAHLAQNPV